MEAVDNLPCIHTEAEPVTSVSGEIVAGLCRGCNMQLAAEWFTCEHIPDGLAVGTIGSPYVKRQCVKCKVGWHELAPTE